MLGIDRERLWRKLFAFDHDGVSVGGDALDKEDASAESDPVDRLCRLIQDAVARGQDEPLRHMLLQRVGYWVRADVAPTFWRFFERPSALLEAAQGQTARQRRGITLFVAEQLTLALQFAEEAFAHCVQIASLFDDGSESSLPSEFSVSCSN